MPAAIDVSRLVLPRSAGEVKRVQRRSPFAVFLVAGHTTLVTEAEHSIWKTLDALHGASPIGRVFLTYDASSEIGEFGPEINIAPYRGFPDPQITRTILTSMIEQGQVAAGFAFACTANPAPGLEAYDDPYGWAVQRDVIDELNLAASRIGFVAAYRAAFLTTDSTEPVDQLVAMIRLAWPAREWRERQHEVDRIDPAVALAEFAFVGDAFQPMVEYFAAYRRLASQFYEAALSRAAAIVCYAVQRLRDGGATAGAVVVPHGWLDVAMELLRDEDVSCVRVIPPDMGTRAVLDEAGAISGDRADSNRRLKELFSGEKKIRGRIEALSTREREERAERVERWLMAAYLLSRRGDGTRATACFDRALEIDPTSAEAWHAAGAQAAEQERAADAVRILGHALRLDPMRPKGWAGYGVSLDGIGQHDAARQALHTGIYLYPREGLLWGALGYHYFNKGDRPAASYCLQQGARFNDPGSAENYEMLRGWGSEKQRRPFSLSPTVITLMGRVVLPVRRRLMRGIRIPGRASTTGRA